MVLGANGDGQLGDSTTTSRLTATQVSGLTGVIAISAGSEHTCAVKQNRTVVCWGRTAVVGLVMAPRQTG